MNPIKFLLWFVYIIILVNAKENKAFYRCGVDDDKVVPLPATNFIRISKDKRRLTNDLFKDFHIYLDLINIKNDIIKYNLEKYETLFINSLNKAVKTLESLLRVRDLGSGFLFSDENITDILIEDWNKTMVGNNATKNIYELGIDLIIF